MKTIPFLFAAFLALAFISCNDDDDVTTNFDYHAHIHHPDTLVKQIGDTLTIEIEFESHTGQPVHHIHVQIYNKSTLAVVYNQPGDSDIHEVTGAYTFEDEFILSTANGLVAGDWILEAKVWGETDGQEEVSETVEFQLQE